MTSQSGTRAAVSAGTIAQIRRDVEVRLLPDGQSFEVGFRSPHPQVAHQVAVRLLYLYFESNTNNQANASEGAVQLLDQQVTEVRSRLLAETVAMRPAAGPRPHAPDPQTKRLEHERLKATFRALLMKREQALISGNLVRRQIGETFRPVEAAGVPDTPISPNRPLIAAEGATAGFLIGIALMQAGRNGTLRRLTRALARP
ncbi:MAG: hypothetical protein ABIX28_19840 [Vicinamibacterales bacterium]